MEFNVEEIMLAYNEYLDTLQNQLVKVAEDIREGNNGIIDTAIAELSEGVQWLYDTNSRLKILDNDITFELGTLNSIFEQLNDSLKMKDYFLTADILEYELSTFFGNVERYVVN